MRGRYQQLTFFVTRAVVCIFFPPLRVYLHAAVPNDLWHDAVEGQLFVKGLDALVFGIMELPGAVEVQNMPEHLRVSVEEVLLRVLVVEKLLL